MNDLLFFKVWRNMVIRNYITGFKRLILIREKNEIYNNASSILNSMEINFINTFFKEDYLFELLKKNNEHTQNLETVLEYFYNREKEIRTQSLQHFFSNNSVLFRKNSELINSYINTLEPEKRKKIPSINVILSTERSIINKMFFNLENQFKRQGLLLIGKYKNRLTDFIINGGDLNELIKNEILIQKRRKISILDSEFKKNGIKKDNLKYPEKYIEHINTFNYSEIKKKNIWSTKKIVDEELKWLKS
ncbi:hypothetical protein ACTFIZ_000413 [Dictyostelium cf. discoideum]